MSRNVFHAHRKSRLHTDESKLYDGVGSEFTAHEAMLHSAKGCARGEGADLATTNSVTGMFGAFTRGMVGVYQHCGEQHLQRYLDEFKFKYNRRSKLGVEDEQHARIAAYAINHKRLTNWRPDEA